MLRRPETIARPGALPTAACPLPLILGLRRARHGLVLVSLEVGPRQIAALERLALLDVDDRDKASIAWAVSRFLDAAPHLAAIGDALWPESEEAE